MLAHTSLAVCSPYHEPTRCQGWLKKSEPKVAVTEEAQPKAEAALTAAPKAVEEKSVVDKENLVNAATSKDAAVELPKKPETIKSQQPAESAKPAKRVAESSASSKETRKKVKTEAAKVDQPQTKQTEDKQKQLSRLLEKAAFAGTVTPRLMSALKELGGHQATDTIVDCVTQLVQNVASMAPQPLRLLSNAGEYNDGRKKVRSTAAGKDRHVRPEQSQDADCFGTLRRQFTLSTREIRCKQSATLPLNLPHASSRTLLLNLPHVSSRTLLLNLSVLVLPLQTPSSHCFLRSLDCFLPCLPTVERDGCDSSLPSASRSLPRDLCLA